MPGLLSIAVVHGIKPRSYCILKRTLQTTCHPHPPGNVTERQSIHRPGITLALECMMPGASLLQRKTPFSSSKEDWMTTTLRHMAPGIWGVCTTATDCCLHRLDLAEALGPSTTTQPNCIVQTGPPQFTREKACTLGYR